MVLNNRALEVSVTKIVLSASTYFSVKALKRVQLYVFYLVQV